MKVRDFLAALKDYDDDADVMGLHIDDDVTLHFDVSVLEPDGIKPEVCIIELTTS